MGILYNRFTPEPPPFLIPYSNRSNILTYLVPSSFNGSSSTVWGDDYPVPMAKETTDVHTIWQYNSDNSINLHGHFTINPQNYGIDPISKYTVYLVARYNKIKGSHTAFNPSFELISRLSYNDKIYEGYGVQTRASLITSRSGTTYTSVLTPAVSTYVDYHAYAFRYVRGKYAHVIDDQNLVTISASNYNARSAYNFVFRHIYEENTGQDDSSVDVKFISIVRGEESDSTILNNVSNIIRKLNLP